jgi:two-component system chemotaxis response regulator CheB
VSADPTEPQPNRRLPGTAFDVVALAASAGGLEALSRVLERLPAAFPAAVAIVQHLDPRHTSLLSSILQRRSVLRVLDARADDPLCAGSVYVAPPDRHLLINPGLVIELSRAELVHFVRPSADLLFESLAACCGPRALGVVLTGMGSDGNMGVIAIRRTGGRVIVQDPADAQFGGMPRAAVASGSADYVLPLAAIPDQILRLVAGQEANEPT